MVAASAVATVAMTAMAMAVIILFQVVRLKAYSEGYGSSIGGDDKKAITSYIAISDGSVTTYSTQHGSGIGGVATTAMAVVLLFQVVRLQHALSVTAAASAVVKAAKGNSGNITISGGSVAARSKVVWQWHRRWPRRQWQ